MHKWQHIWMVSVMAVLLLGLSAIVWLKPTSEYSDTERRALADFPSLSSDFSEDFEAYAQDQFPLRDTFRSIKAFTAFRLFQQLDNNGLYVKDGHISRLEPVLNETMLDHAASRFQYLYDTYLTDSNVYFSIIPDKNYFLTGSADEAGAGEGPSNASSVDEADGDRLSGAASSSSSQLTDYPALDYDKLVAYMQKSTSYMSYIDIFPLLSIDDYYKTDTHWRQECIQDVAAQLAAEMGTALTADYETRTAAASWDGVYSGQLALPIAGDMLNYVTNDALEQCIVTSYDSGTAKSADLYDLTAIDSKDPYTFFPDDAVLVIENPSATTDKELILFRDSFGGSIAPYFCEAYAKVTLIDIRYVNPSLLGEWIRGKGQDVLFLYSTMMLSNSSALK